ncbi:serpentine type 7TM GPCR chemoreceptor srt domain-containing protein [Ditylenchus destructor]|uniref:Serpentine type 7TM GPCR chemoreceptor srt domain-containing protein n=1 Tax=Ditylenchus destructor TaxID=166010 RepID=A0AAD4QW74_9BILA|nr:serpentine type 7TM GPCR chemoreceptor srt domain-containing protein [Ditylenchus destructor]
MQFFRTREFVIYVGQYMWICSHGAPGVIYLLMNKTIRKDVFRLFRKKATTSSSQENILIKCQPVLIQAQRNNK